MNRPQAYVGSGSPQGWRDCRGWCRWRSVAWSHDRDRPAPAPCDHCRGRSACRADPGRGREPVVDGRHRDRHHVGGGPEGQGPDRRARGPAAGPRRDRRPGRPVRCHLDGELAGPPHPDDAARGAPAGAGRDRAGDARAHPDRARRGPGQRGAGRGHPPRPGHPARGPRPRPGDQGRGAPGRARQGLRRQGAQEPVPTAPGGHRPGTGRRPRSQAAGEGGGRRPGRHPTHVLGDSRGRLQGRFTLDPLTGAMFKKAVLAYAAPKHRAAAGPLGDRKPDPRTPRAARSPSSSSATRPTSSPRPVASTPPSSSSMPSRP